MNVVVGEVSELFVHIVLEQKKLDVLAVQYDFGQRRGTTQMVSGCGQLVPALQGVQTLGTVQRM